MILLFSSRIKNSISMSWTQILLSIKTNTMVNGLFLKNSVIMFCRLERCFFDTLAYQYPGRSTRCRSFLVSWSHDWTVKKFTSWVFHGLPLTFARFFWLHMVLMRVDFPTFDLQIKANSWPVCSGQVCIDGADVRKVAECIGIHRVIYQNSSMLLNFFWISKRNFYNLYSFFFENVLHEISKVTRRIDAIPFGSEWMCKRYKVWVI